MNSLIVMLALFGQTPSIETDMRDEMIAHILVQKGIEAAQKATTYFESQSDQQIRILFKVYQREIDYRVAEQQARQQQIINNAILERDRLRAYRDHLSREFELAVVQKNQEMSLMRQAQIYQMQQIRNGFYGNGNGINNNPNGYRPRFPRYRY